MLEDFILWAPRIAACVLLLMGLMGFFKPRAITDKVGIQLTNAIAMSEARSIFGGMQLGIASAALILDTPAVYATIGMAFIGVLITRIYSLFVDRGAAKQNIGAIIVDAILGLPFVLSATTLIN